MKIFVVLLFLFNAHNVFACEGKVLNQLNNYADSIRQKFKGLDQNLINFAQSLTVDYDKLSEEAKILTEQDLSVLLKTYDLYDEKLYNISTEFEGFLSIWDEQAEDNLLTALVECSSADKKDVIEMAIKQHIDFVNQDESLLVSIIDKHFKYTEELSELHEKYLELTNPMSQNKLQYQDLIELQQLRDEVLFGAECTKSLLNVIHHNYCEVSNAMGITSAACTEDLFVNVKTCI